MRAIIDTNGKVSDVTVRSIPVKPSSDLAVEAMSPWRYKPAYCKDLRKPVRVDVRCTTTFALHRN